MIVLILLLFSIIPIMFIAAVQLMFCYFKYKLLQFLPLAATFGFTIWCVMEQAQIEQSEQPVGCGMVKMVGDTMLSVIFVALFLGIALGWIVYFKRSASEQKKEEPNKE